MSKLCSVTRRVTCHSKLARLPSAVVFQSWRGPPARAFSLKILRPRFASDAAAPRKSPPPSPGPFPYPSSVDSSNPPPSHVKLKSEKATSEEGPLNQLKNVPQTSFDERKVAVGWDAITWSRFHNIWLRDHCRCSECFHPVTKQRLLDTFEIPVDVQPSEVTGTEAGLEVIWQGTIPHRSLYPWTWLHQNSYDPPLRSPAARPSTPLLPHHEKVLWGSRIQQDPPTVQYNDVMTDEHAVLKWLEKIGRFGFCFVSCVPANPEDTERLSRRISHIRETQCQDIASFQKLIADLASADGSFWDFTADLKHGDTAYTNVALKAHTDTTYFTDPCGLQLFHLLSHTEGIGGSTLLVDGFYVASLLSTLHPDVHALLSQVPVPAHSAGASSTSPSSLSYLYYPEPQIGYPILNYDQTTGELTQVRYNNDDRSVMRHLEPGMVKPWYHALRTWDKALTSQDSEYWVQLAPGTAVIINNQRVLHGRSAFTGQRRMCGAYIGMDDYRSRLNVLQTKFGPSSAHENTAPGSVWDPAF